MPLHPSASCFSAPASAFARGPMCPDLLFRESWRDVRSAVPVKSLDVNHEHSIYDGIIIRIAELLDPVFFLRPLHCFPVPEDFEALARIVTRSGRAGRPSSGCRLRCTACCAGSQQTRLVCSYMTFRKPFGPSRCWTVGQGCFAINSQSLRRPVWLTRCTEDQLQILGYSSFR
jgi:hypothetical protein